jgi:hypothetical protein
MLANPTFEEKINDWLRTFRKKRAFRHLRNPVARRTGEAEILGGICDQRPNADIFACHQRQRCRDGTDPAPPVQPKRCADRPAGSGAVPKQDYLLLKPGMTRLVQARMPKVVIAINEGTTRREFRKLAADAAKSGIAGWEMDFLREVLHV